MKYKEWGKRFDAEFVADGSFKVQGNYLEVKDFIKELLQVGVGEAYKLGLKNGYSWGSGKTDFEMDSDKTYKALKEDAIKYLQTVGMLETNLPNKEAVRKAYIKSIPEGTIGLGRWAEKLEKYKTNPANKGDKE